MSYSMSSPNDWYSLSVFPTVNKIIDHSISDAFAVVASWYFEWQTQDMHLWQGKQVISMKWVYNGCLGCACWKIICHAHIGPLTREQSKMMDSPKARGGFVYGCRKHIWTWQHMPSCALVWRKGSSDTSLNTLGFQNCQRLDSKITILKKWIHSITVSGMIEVFLIINDKDSSLCCQSVLFPLDELGLRTY